MRFPAGRRRFCCSVLFSSCISKRPEAQCPGISISFHSQAHLSQTIHPNQRIFTDEKQISIILLRWKKHFVVDRVTMASDIQITQANNDATMLSICRFL